MEQQNTTNFEAIIAFIQSLELPNKVTAMDQLVDGCVFSDILFYIGEFSLENDKLQPTDNWSQALSNTRIILKSLKRFCEQIFNKPLQIHHLDLISVCKNRDWEDISKLFFVILGVLVQSSAKEYFIGKILTLPENHQTYFMQKIQKILFSYSSENLIKDRQLHLLETINELQSQNLQFQKQMDKLASQNIKLKKQAKQLGVKLLSAGEDAQKLKQQTILEMQKKKNKSTVEDQKMIQSLKDKLRVLIAQHDTEIESYRQEIALLSNKNQRVAHLESQVQFYKENYQQAIQHMKQMGNWDQQKIGMTRDIQKKNQQILEQQQMIQQLNGKISELSSDLLQLQVSNQRLNVRNTELSSVANRMNSNRFNNSTNKINVKALSEVVPDLQQQNMRCQLEKQIDKKSKKIGILQKQVQKFKFKADRAHQLQKQKARLQVLIMQQNQARLDEIQLLTSCLYELWMRCMALSQQKKLSKIC